MQSDQKQFIPVAEGESTGQQTQALPVPALPAWSSDRTCVPLGYTTYSSSKLGQIHGIWQITTDIKFFQILLLHTVHCFTNNSLF